MPLIGWIRDLFGIQKDMYDTKRTRLEINRLERIEKLEQEVRSSLITPAALEDVKKYDPKIAQIERNIKKEREAEGIEHRHGGLYPLKRGLWVLFQIWVVVAGLLVTALIIIVMLRILYHVIVG